MANWSYRPYLVRSFRVWSEHHAIPPSNALAVTLRPPRLDHVSQVVVPPSFYCMDVPSGLAVVAYSSPGFGGTRTDFPAALYEYGPPYRDITSFQVVRDSSTVPSSAAPLATVTCVRNFSRPSLVFDQNKNYSMLMPGACTSLDIPRGLTIVAFDSAWFLGGCQCQDHPFQTWLSPLASLQVMRRADAPLQPPPRLAPPRVEPALNSWEANLTGFVTISPGARMVVYEDYNFQGQSMALTGSHAFVAKSYKLFWEAEAASLDTPRFVGCFPVDFGLKLVPIFMKAGDAIASLIYPWNGNIAQFAIPTGLAVVAYSEPNFNVSGDSAQYIVNKCPPSR
ncbi:Aste57867_11880 [Aphanomyces stellatus]|uniref:Aste57867_11880 protein n=1 Tax=Aphanomyces stellatus TaxID=120398 RepID=A0A485KUR5_9STRA|nr:hypothetical protein As57867_011835 [Aphanomyces stellatus]VFT88735.1 Aste57867_11880 [Aphanomyces stellatus]